MKYKLYTMYDSVAGIFFAPSMETNDGAAMRSFVQLMKMDKFKDNRKDYDLYSIGSFDVTSGVMETKDRLFVCNGSIDPYEEDDLL